MVDSARKYQKGLYSLCLSALSCPALCNPVDCSPPGSSVRASLQARRLEQVAISFSRGSSRPRDRTIVFCIACVGRWLLYHCATWEAVQFVLAPGNFFCTCSPVLKISRVDISPFFEADSLMSLYIERASLVAQTVKNLLAVQEIWVQSLGWEDPLDEGMAIHSSILAWKIPRDKGTWRARVHGVAKSQT